jgi:hypothetical protein
MLTSSLKESVQDDLWLFISLLGQFGRCVINLLLAAGVLNWRAW